jgi:hypothetical protein
VATRNHLACTGHAQIRIVSREGRPLQGLWGRLQITLDVKASTLDEAADNVLRAAATTGLLKPIRLLVQTTADFVEADAAASPAPSRDCFGWCCSPSSGATFAWSAWWCTILKLLTSAARSGQSRAQVLRGDAGISKTTLLDEYAAR